MNDAVGKLAYGLLFAVVFPLLLAAWAWRLDALLSLPFAGEPWHGVVIATAGALLIVFAIVSLRLHGHGWPMSPYPPERRVSTGAYAVVSDPIYFGCVILAAGLSIALRSGSGLWIVTPALALACAAFALGYEHEQTDRRFGPAPHQPLIRLPQSADTKPELADRASIYLIVLLPWLVAFEAVNALGIPQDVVNGITRIDALVPMIPWTEIFYFADYPLVLAVPLIASTRRQLRDFAIQGWVAIVSLTTLYLALPVIVRPKEAPLASFFTPLMLWERNFDTPMTAFPAFHVVWALIAANAFARVWPRLRIVWWLVAAAITVSCLTTGMHALPDVIAGVLIAIPVIHCRRVWRSILDATEHLANSWREWDLGAVRMMSHAIYAAIGAFLGIVIISTLTGGTVAVAVVVGAATIFGAAMWAQWIEGSPQLLRPYGYYGGLIGGGIAIAAMPRPWLVLAATAIAATVIQPFGRCRCLLQGCCHGRPSPDEIGIRYSHPRSRVTRLSDLAGKSVHPTQLYSIAWNAVLFVVLMRLWIVGAPLQFIAGAYLLLSGIERFVEEHFRGEPQTPSIAGFRIYQWLAIGSFFVGAMLMACGNAPAPAPGPTTLWSIAVAALFGIGTYIAYGVDFPRLNTRFARLV